MHLSRLEPKTMTKADREVAVITAIGLGFAIIAQILLII
ncbi:hypothetical protein AM1_B0038 (plasmid) [Acaryochloris marina MBIC11017]|uniref:Uncharacterized protein n=1 Tax=Acaryochloris marina (strain MBIC 11017) TaxID=329726 RepID=A8ZLZ5_ACAM1|nr:hypothetical protein AM1_B0038 [Acaryochloris marina MBIC11017]